ncbi:MAG: four helix bundle protein [Anaerolineales bacterium]
MSYALKPSHSSYRDLVVWQKSMDFANAVIDLTESLQTDRKHYRLVEQLEAAATSVPMNIAEGKGRFSRKEFSHFLFIARGSLYETMTLLDIFKMRTWISPPAFDALESRATEIAKMLNGLINSIPKDD